MRVVKILKETLRGNKWFILFVTVIAPFMATLDASVTNIALPVMAHKLHVDSGAISWVSNSYFVTLIVDILFFGKLGDLKGRTKVFQFGVLILTIGSILCSISPTFTILIAARVIQALGAGAAMANSQGIIASVFPKNERGKALGINGAFVALGIITGPSLGGFIVSTFGWTYMFWINIPIGIFICIAGLFVFPHESTSNGRIDVLGTLLFAVSMFLLFYALQECQKLGFFSHIILACLVIAIVCFAAFIILQKRIAEPLLDLSIFHNKWFSVSIFCSYTSYFAIACFSFVLPFYLEDVHGMSAGTAGLYMAIYPLLLALISPLSGALSDKIGSKILTLIGLLLTCAGLVFVAYLTREYSLGIISFIIAVMGIGNGAFQSPNNSIVMSTVSSDKMGIAGSVNALVRYIGQAMGIAISNVLLYGGMSIKLGKHITNFTVKNAVGVNAFLFGMKFACIVGSAICLTGVVLTVSRLGDGHLKN